VNITVRTNPGAYAPPREGRRRVPRGLLATGREAIIFCCIFALPSLIVVYEEPPMKCTGRMRMTLPRTAKVFGVAPTAATKDTVRRKARLHSRLAPPPIHFTADPLREDSAPLFLKRRCDRRPLACRCSSSTSGRACRASLCCCSGRRRTSASRSNDTLCGGAIYKRLQHTHKQRNVSGAGRISGHAIRARAAAAASRSPPRQQEAGRTSRTAGFAREDSTRRITRIMFSRTFCVVV
jgi:hypothetical protein